MAATTIKKQAKVAEIITPQSNKAFADLTTSGHMADRQNERTVEADVAADGHPATQTRHSHVVPGPRLSTSIPEGFALAPNETAFDPAVHLQIELPKNVYALDFERVSFPPPSSSEGFDLAYTEPFRLLSDEGTRVLKDILYSNEAHAKSNARIPKCLRGVGYRSQFVRDLTFSNEMLELVSAMVGKPLAPHSMAMNHAHTNWGRKVNVKSGEEAVIVDQWHNDSVDYVMVLILSDTSKSIGGELEVLHKTDVRDNDEFLQKGIGPDSQHLVHSTPYPGAGYAIVMQGSQILHRVSPVMYAEEPRVSCVTSFMSRDVFDADSTRFHTFNEQDPEHVNLVEYAKHQAWRVGGVMDYVQEKLKWGTPADEISGLLRNAATTLERSARLVEGSETDKIMWIDHKTIQSKFELAADQKKIMSKL